jgi:hypothetical protein
VHSARSALGGAGAARYAGPSHAGAPAAPSVAASAAPSIPRSVRSVASARSTRSRALDTTTEHVGPHHARPTTPAEGLAAALRAAAREGGPPPLPAHAAAPRSTRPATAQGFSGTDRANMSAGATLSAQLKQLSAVKY